MNVPGSVRTKRRVVLQCAGILATVFVFTAFAEFYKQLASNQTSLCILHEQLKIVVDFVVFLSNLVVIL